MTIQSISPKELGKLREAGEKIDLIDVRTPVEFREVHAEPAQNVPLDKLDPSTLLASRNGSGSEPLYVICRSGKRGHQACEKFVDAGFTNVVNVEGGTQAWQEAGLHVVRGKKAVSLERQVRIVAGLMVVTGAVLALTVHPYFAAIPAFVGAGLTFAGITDTCAMGMLLAKMPWNQVKENDASCAVK